MKKIVCWLSIVVSVVSLTCFCNPRISIITSVFKGDKFINEFLDDITRQTIFDQCELIMINANSPGNEEPVIQKYMQKYPNIRYCRLDKDPGIYGVWNMAIKMSTGQYITNANLDDRLAHNAYEVFAKELDYSPNVVLVYGEMYCTHKPNETFENNAGFRVAVPKFSRKNMSCCLPGCCPMWRKSMHERYGFFDETYKSSGDYEMWLRAVEGGAKLKKVPGCYALYYENPQGISTSATSPRHYEDQRILKRYSHVWTGDEYRSNYKLACKLDELDPKEQRVRSVAINYYLKAFAAGHDHAEPLVRIAQYYYKEGDNHLAYLFVKRACELEEPKNLDSEELELYRYTRYDLLGIVAWYVGEFNAGEEAVEKALEWSPHNEHLQRNLNFYLNCKK